MANEIECLDISSEKGLDFRCDTLGVSVAKKDYSLMPTIRVWSVGGVVLQRLHQADIVKMLAKSGSLPPLRVLF